MNAPIASKKHRILVVDDNPAIHEDFRKIFHTTIGNESMATAEAALFDDAPVAPVDQPAEFSIDSAQQGQEGLARVQQAIADARPYAMAFVDVRMPPGWDGIETIARIWEVYPDLQVVICTAYSDYSWDEMLAKLGKSDRLVILKKPFDNIEVLQLAGALAEKWRLLQQTRQHTLELEATIAKRTLELRKSEERFRLITENVADLIAIVDPQGKRLYNSPSYERLLGYNQDDLQATLAFTQIHPEDRDRVAAAAHKATETGVGAVLEYRMQHKEGSWLTLESHGVAFRNANGEIEGVLTVARDVTERKRAEESLCASEQMLRLVLDTIPVRVFWKNRASAYLGGNRLFAKDAGVDSPLDLVGRFDSELVWREQAEQYRNDDQLFMEQGEARLRYEEPQTTPDGRLITLLTSKIPMRDQQGLIIGILGIYEDITERKKSEELLRLREAALRATANAVVITNRKGLIVWTNAAFTKETGYTAEEVLGRSPRILKSCEHPPSFYQSLWQTITSGQVWHGEFHNRRKDGTKLIEDATITPVLDEAGQLTHFIAVKQNITERKAAELVTLRLAAIVESSNDAIIGKDLSGIITSWNRGAEKTFGYAADEMVGTSILRLIPADRHEEEKQILMTLRRGEGIENFETVRQTKSGRMIDIAVTVSVIKDAAGNVVGVSKVARDITERKQSDEKLRESQRLLQSTLDALSAHIAILDETGVIIAVNAVWRNFAEANDFMGRMSGIGLNYLEVCESAKGTCAEESMHVAAGIRAVMVNQRTGFQLEYPCHSPNEQRWFEVRVTRFAGDGPMRIVVAHENITERVKSDRDRKNIELHLRQTQKLESIGQLAAGVAHEINTPTQYIGDNTQFLRDAFNDLLPVMSAPRQILDAIRDNCVTPELLQTTETALQLADVDYLSNEIPKAIEQTLQGVERVAKIVRAMKEFSHPGTAEKTKVDLNHCIDSTLTVARNEWKYVADLVTEFDPDLPTVLCLPGEFNQVILNLVVNAAHAIGDSIKEGENRKGTITVTTKQDGDWVEVRLRDTGTGIPESARGKIFDPFFTTKSVGKGTGQGLAIAHSVIVEKHGGTITFETELGQGTVFIIRLPLTADEEKETT